MTNSLEPNVKGPLWLLLLIIVGSVGIFYLASRLEPKTLQKDIPFVAGKGIDVHEETTKEMTIKAGTGVGVYIVCDSMVDLDGNVLLTTCEDEYEEWEAIYNYDDPNLPYDW